MTTAIDLRGESDAQHGELLFEALDAAETGEVLDVVAGRDVDPDLARYQIEQDCALE